MTVRKIDLAYIAGLMDGEAYIGIKKSRPYACQGRVTPGYHARIQIRMTDEESIKFVAETLGGKYALERRNIANRQDLYCWAVSDALAARILEVILPYLRVKRRVAKSVLDLRVLQASRMEHKTKITGQRYLRHWCGKSVMVNNTSFSDEYVGRCESLYLQARQLNAVGAKGKEVRDGHKDHERRCIGQVA